MFINVPPPSRHSMVPFPHVEHFASKVNKVGVSLKHAVEPLIGLLP